MSTLRMQIRQETLGPLTDMYITPIETYPPIDFVNEKSDLEVLPPPSLPEGGTAGWMNVAGGYVFHCNWWAQYVDSNRLLVMFCTLGSIVSFGAYQDIYSVSLSFGLILANANLIFRHQEGLFVAVHAV